MIKGYQLTSLKAKNKNAKYSLSYRKGQTITGNDQQIKTKYSYSKVISLLMTKKYSYSL